MHLAFIDWLIVAGFLLSSLLIGVIVSRRAGKNSSEFFLSGRSMPWWLLGFSMVATTFSTDTPNLITNMVRSHGVAGNWEWWILLLTGMMTVFIYAKLWRRSGLMTDIQFYELRYGGKAAAFLRAFRAGYMTFVFGMIGQATVTLGAIKIFGVMIGMERWQVIFIMGGITAIYSMVGGLSGVIWTDFFQFGVAMTGSIAAAVVAVNLPQVGGLQRMLAHPNVVHMTSFIPHFDNPDLVVTIFVMPLAVYWWAMWYPGAEPGGGGWVVQRMLSAKNERHAMGATLFFQFANYALRPWPWILVALASLVVYPDVAALKTAFPNMPAAQVRNDMAYPAMLTYLPTGLMGLVVASLVAAYMSTISTQLNLMSSYVANDFYKRFIFPAATEKQMVRVGRIATVGLLCVSSTLALYLQSALDSFQIILQIGAGTGLVFLLRWFWWRISAYSEISAMLTSFAGAIFFKFIYPRLGFTPLQSWQTLLIGIGCTTFVWLLVTHLTPPTDPERLRHFYRLVRPGGPGWKRVRIAAAAEGQPLEEAPRWDVSLGILCVIVGCITVYSALFAAGNWIYGNTLLAFALTATSIAGAIAIFVLWRRLSMDDHIPAVRPTDPQSKSV